MAIPLIPVAALALGALSTLSLLAIQNLLQDRSFDDDPVLSPPSSQLPPFVPPFVGGQCVGATYVIQYRYRQINSDGSVFLERFNTFSNSNIYRGDIASITVVSLKNGDSVNGVRVAHRDSSGNRIFANVPVGNTFFTGDSVLSDVQVQRTGGLPDNCGDVPNPNDPIPPSVGGGNLAPLPDDDPELVYAGAIVAPALGYLATLAAIAAAIKAAADTLDGIKKIGEAIDELRKLLEENEKEKPKNRTLWNSPWVSLSVDGGIFIPLNQIGDVKLYPYQIQIEIEAFPSTCSRRLGIASPSFAHEEPIGWVFPRSANFGYSESVAIRFLRNSISINQDTNGISYSFRENPSVKAKMRVWYSSDPIN